MNSVPRVVSGPASAPVQPGYIHRRQWIPDLGLGPGVLLPQNQNTNGFAFQQLASNGGLPSYCSVAGWAAR